MNRNVYLNILGIMLSIILILAYSFIKNISILTVLSVIFIAYLIFMKKDFKPIDDRKQLIFQIVVTFILTLFILIFFHTINPNLKLRVVISVITANVISTNLYKLFFDRSK